MHIKNWEKDTKINDSNKPDETNHVSNGDSINLKTNFWFFECWPAGEIDSEWKTTKKKNLRTQFSYPHPSSEFTLLKKQELSICSIFINLKVTSWYG